MNVLMRNIKISPKKLRVSARQISGLSVANALLKLAFAPQKSAKIVHKALRSAIANADHNFNADIEDLKVAAVSVDQGMVLKRYTQKAKGRGARILKRYSHLLIELEPMGAV